MRTQKVLRDHIVLILYNLSSILLLLINNTKFIHAGTSSTPKNLVNLYTNSPNNDNNLNLTNLSQFQNEYQYRQAASKLPTTSSTDRYKSTTQPSINSEPSVFEHLPTDLSNNNAGTLDYSYHDDRGFTTNVPDCKGRLKLTRDRGFITDGAAFYSTNLQCVWLIDSGRNNATIRIQILQFNTECNYDYLYIFDGDSIYSPLIAALSGDMKDFGASLMEANYRNVISSSNNTYDNNNSNDNSNISSSISLNTELIPAMMSPLYSTLSSPMSESHPLELRTYSGKAFIYFHSDTAQSMPGFYITYTIDSCPLDCSNRGECDFNTLKCRCNTGYSGDGCQYQSCPNNCTSTEHGSCDKEKSCVCNKDYFGNDCSLKSDQQNWIRLVPNLNSSIQNNDEKNIIPPKAFHQAIIVDEIMYIIGGKTQASSNTNMGIYRKKSVSMIYSLDIKTKIWSDMKIFGTTGIDHLAELTGHSVAAKGQKIFIYGGMAMNNTILNSLSVYDTKKRTLTTLTNGQQSSTKIKSQVSLNEDDLIPPIAVVGHTANIIDSHMYIFLGYNPLYGYLNFVQKFNLADNSWSLVGKKGSFISGYLGHTSTYDPVDRLVYLYGGHDAHRLNSLYSFDPNTEVWKYLQPGLSPRYYHSAVIVNRQLIILGGNSYNTSHLSDQCFQQTYLTYDLTCTNSSNTNEMIINENNNNTSNSNMIFSTTCGRKCWHSINEQPNLSIMKRHGHSIVYNSNDNELILFGGFNGVLMNDIRLMNISKCEAFNEEYECIKPRLGISCYWNSVDSECVTQITNQFNASINPDLSHTNCTKNEQKVLQQLCETRETCSDCLNTNQGCVWCGFLARCHYSKCKSSTTKAILDSDLCYKDEFIKTSLIGINLGSNPIKDLQVGQDFDHVMECKRLENCYLCHSRPYCSWQNDGCAYNAPGVLSQAPTSNLLGSPPDEMNDIYNSVANQPTSLGVNPKLIFSNSTRFMRRFDPFHRSLFATLSTNHLNTSPHSCDLPCYMRRSCNECTTTKCIWCSTSEQCIDSSAYFAYHAMGQCMHYVAHMLKCPIASCAGIETCDKCLANPRCGWLNDISNSGKGRCIEGTSSGPIFGNISIVFDDLLQGNSSSTAITSSSSINTPLDAQSINSQSWFYTSCPSCQCNGHSYCRPSNNSFCLQPCQDFTEGQHCERCIQGYFGDPINGGICRPCDCNGHAQTCHKETGKCYCSTKGITGHTCNRCDDQNHYIGDLTNQGNGTCYYNLTTDYQYTFNMSKPEDHFYNDINFINVPLRKDSDLDFTIACSRLALVNITSGTSFKNRKPIHTSLECGSFRLRFPHDRHVLSEANYSFFVHVYKFQTPFILQIAFSQHRTLYLPQFFFTFSSCFLFFFALSGLVWKLKHEYDIYIRRQRQFIEMEQMASRPFSTVLLEMFTPKLLGKNSELEPLRTPSEPTPISFEPCFGNNVGVMSLFVQLPGRPNLAIASALVTLNDKFIQSDETNKRQSDKEQVSV